MEIKCLQCENKFNKEHILKLSRCQHSFCFKCLCKYVSNNLNVTINCPLKNCKFKISDGNIRECLSDYLIDQYERMSLGTCSSLRKCLTKSCPFYIMTECNSIIFQCKYCEQPNCLQCSKRHYPSQGCYKYINEKQMDIEAEQNLKNIKRKQILFNDKDHNILPNTETCTCCICCEFIAPRKGWILRNCLDHFCRSCLNTTFSDYKFLNQLSCPACKIPLEQREATELIGFQKLLKMSIKDKCYRFFICKGPDCENYWSCNKNTGFHKCEKCKKENCLQCKVIHEGKSCQEYMNSKDYKNDNYDPGKMEEIICYNCGKCLIRGGGCSSMTCDNCNNNTCLHTGKAIGDEGCRCTTSHPCHAECRHGCIPD